MDSIFVEMARIENNIRVCSGSINKKRELIASYQIDIAEGMEYIKEQEERFKELIKELKDIDIDSWFKRVVNAEEV
jgi:rubrerythrin